MTDEVDRVAYVKALKLLGIEPREIDNELYVPVEEYDVVVRERNQAIAREKYWQTMAGKFARSANFIYGFLNEADLAEDELDMVYDMRNDWMEYLEFDEDL